MDKIKREAQKGATLLLFKNNVTNCNKMLEKEVDM